MRVILKMCDLPAGRGWDDTITKLKDNKKSDEFESGFNQLKEWYHNHLLVGEKAIKLFSVPRSRIDNLIRFFVPYEIKETPFKETYPFPLADEQLTEIDSSPKLVEIRDLDTSLMMIFCTNRLFIERTEIDLKGLSSEAKKDFNDYEKLIGIKQYKRQFFDIFVLWKNKDFIEVRVDIANGMPSQEERSEAFTKVIKEFNVLIKHKLNIETVLKESINFFPLIDRLYESDEGDVVELAFTTDEGSIKSEKMRRGKCDLRDETYHKAGRKAIDHITPYKLAILWEFTISEDLNTHPELLMPGQAIMLSKEDQELGEIIILKCSSLADYNFVLEKIIHYLKL